MGASAEEADRLRAREQAQANARIAEAQAVSEAKKTVAEGGAQTATEVRPAPAADPAAGAGREALPAPAGTGRRQHGAGAELTTQYNGPMAAINDDTNTRIALAQQEADERAAAVAAEKQAVLEQGRRRGRRPDATGSRKTTAASRVAELQRALTSLPENVTTTITVNEVVRNSSATTSSGACRARGQGRQGAVKGRPAAGGSSSPAAQRPSIVGRLSRRMRSWSVSMPIPHRHPSISGSSVH